MLNSTIVNYCSYSVFCMQNKKWLQKAKCFTLFITQYKDTSSLKCYQC